MAEELTTGQIQAALRGERKAVKHLVAHFLPRVYGLCARLAGNTTLAEEASQETFVIVLKKLNTVRHPERLQSWILTIAANTTRRLLQREQKGQPLGELELEAPPPQRDRRKEARQKAVDRAVQKLGRAERELFLLHTVEGIPLKDLARHQGKSLSSIKSKLHRIRARVRQQALSDLKQSGAVA